MASVGDVDPSAAIRARREGLRGRFLTVEDLGTAPDAGFVARQLSGVPRERAVDWCARMLAPSAGPGWRGHQEREARAWFAGSVPAAGALDLVLTGRRHLFAPQVLLHLARLALVHGSDPSDDEPPEVLAGYETAMRAVMLVLAHHAGSERRDRDDALRRPDGMLGLDGSVVTGLEAEVAANLLANHRPFPASALDRSERRWVEIPREDAGCPGVVDLAGEFLAATGVPLQDLRLVGVALWAMVMGGSGPRARPGYLDDLGLGPDRTCRVLGLIGGTAAELAAQERAVAGPGLGSVYDTTVFGRRPVVRLANGGLLVVSPHLLVARTLGWLPWWDLTNALKKSGRDGQRRARRADGYLRRTTERHATETIACLAEAGAPPGVPYGEDQIQAAFGIGQRNADCAVDWPGAWVVAEVSSRSVTRGTAGAVSGEDLVRDITLGVVEKAAQLDGTIRALRADESRLTGAPRVVPRRFWPVLVTTEGFPVHPVVTARVRAMLRTAGLLQEGDVAAVVIVDVEALEAAETVAEQGGPNLAALLARHAVSDMQAHGFREWLLVTHGPLRPPTRIMRRWERALGPVLAALTEAGTTGPG